MYYVFTLNMDWAHEASKLVITGLMRYIGGTCLHSLGPLA